MIERLLARWREADDWQPAPALLDDARRAARRAGYRRWPGFVAPLPAKPPRAEWAPLLLAAYDDFDRLNREHFDGLCPPVRLTINPRLRSAAGRIVPARRTVRLHRADLRSAARSTASPGARPAPLPGRGGLPT